MLYHLEVNKQFIIFAVLHNILPYMATNSTQVRRCISKSRGHLLAISDTCIGKEDKITWFSFNHPHHRREIIFI